MRIPRLHRLGDILNAPGSDVPASAVAGSSSACLYGSADRGEQVLIMIFPDIATMTAAVEINDPDLAIAHPSDPNVPKTAMTQLATIALKNF